MVLVFIHIKTVPHNTQRYNTVGDWYFDSFGDLIITVSDMGNPNYTALVGIHEMVEALLCKARGISEQAVTDFDVSFETARLEGNTDEPGNDPQAPYYKEHKTATHVEKILAKELGVDWEEYDKVVNEL